MMCCPQHAAKISMSCIAGPCVALGCAIFDMNIQQKQTTHNLLEMTVYFIMFDVCAIYKWYPPPPPEEPSTFDGLEKLNCKKKQMQFMTKAQKRCAVHSMLPKYRSHALQVLTSHSVVPSLTSIYSKQQPHTTCLKWQYNTVTFIGTIAHMYCTLCTLLLHQKSLQSL